MQSVKGRLGREAVGLGTENLGNCLIYWLINMVYTSSQSELFQFSGGQKPLIREDYNNQKKLKFWESALVANTYGLNFIKIGGI